jgi:hypothetical protein
MAKRNGPYNTPAQKNGANKITEESGRKEPNRRKNGEFSKITLY